ncbi:MAG: DEAD/DEAH box helicase [Alphaproteobacteria bacterium]|nr:DEAD/DEAH box helicase [Alphaproteobacteria bacterium]
MPTLSLALTPSGQVYLDPSPNEYISEVKAQRVQSLFSKGPTIGLLQLGLEDISAPLPASITFWQKFSRLFISKLCMVAAFEPSNQDFEVSLPNIQDLDEFMTNAPFMTGGEYLNYEVLQRLWQDLQGTLQQYLLAFQGNLQEFLKAYNPQWNLVGRVHFHLTENKSGDNKPFDFLATYTSRLSENTNVQHLPLGRALRDYENQKKTLSSLMLPVRKAAAHSSLLKSLVDSGKLFRPQSWTPRIAYNFLKDISLFEAAGIVVRVPHWWKPKNPPRAQVSVTIGQNKLVSMDVDALLDLNIEMALSDGEILDENDRLKIFNSSENFIFIKGKWIEVDRLKLQEIFKHWHKLKDGIAGKGLSFAEAMRLLVGISYRGEIKSFFSNPPEQWLNVTAGDWLKDILNELRNPETKNAQSIQPILAKHFQATLRPYQMVGVNWLWLLYRLKLGGCLADDMGLGKTIQVLALLILIKNNQTLNSPNLLVIPASLLGNWLSEIQHFAPSLKVWVAHPSWTLGEDLKRMTQEKLSTYDLVITTYSFLQRMALLKRVSWNVMVLDEAQLIKNPSSQQTRYVKSMQCEVRFTLTGTPIENQLEDLWSLFDFICPGLLGSNSEFKKYANKKADQEEHFYGAIRTLVNPYILRRLKSDKRIINDLPDKTEVKAFCSLSKQQVYLYQQSIQELSVQLKSVDGIQRRGIILSYLLRFKQICDHPSLGLGHSSYKAEESGKFVRLKEICEEIAAKQEKVLIFTQFTEIMPALAAFLTSIFGRPGLLLHGKTAIKNRGNLAQQFNEELGPPFFILSLKAGGTGLNLTKASHVVHFDRWWNPAVENQATDRTYRIGQHKNVLVHKFVCRGTIEEKIDLLIESKKSLSQTLLAEDPNILFTDLTNEELINVVSLDIHRVLAED